MCVRQDERGQDKEKSCVEREEGEKWVGQSAIMPEAKTQIESSGESSPAYCSADPINNIPIPVIC